MALSMDGWVGGWMDEWMDGYRIAAQRPELRRLSWDNTLGILLGVEGACGKAKGSH